MDISKLLEIWVYTNTRYHAGVQLRVLSFGEQVEIVFVGDTIGP